MASVVTAFPSWSAEVRCLDLTEEVGELARAVLEVDGVPGEPGQDGSGRVVPAGEDPGTATPALRIVIATSQLWAPILR